MLQLGQEDGRSTHEKIKRREKGMRKLSTIGFVVLLLVQFGCTSYRIERTDNSNATQKIDRTGSAYVSVCEDGRYDAEIYLGSGMATAQVIMNEFLKYLTVVSIGKTQETYDEALKSALYGGYKYFIYPSIEQWEDHATEVTEIRDKLRLTIIVVETLSGEQLDLVMISGKSKFFTVGGDQPQDLLATPIRIYVNSLFE
ncbi:MAG: DUF4823 domain-containing protein [Deltaproteobacteria bacterium]|nr:DUF4823 domain-containing protein [Deltaproteobacteria bacterium]MBW2143893.1 DUF4823 domain-containing protein [Deltaproteobacteria bacterium]